MTQEERETINRRIAEWLGLCWHEIETGRTVPDGFPMRSCTKCKLTNFTQELHNPDFTSWDGMRLLLEGVRQKGYAGDIRFDSVNWTVKLWTAFTLVAHQRLEATADTLPLALVSATLKLIEQEEKDAD